MCLFTSPYQIQKRIPKIMCLLFICFAISIFTVNAAGMAEGEPEREQAETEEIQEPTTIVNDGMEMVFKTIPQRAVTMNQTPTEIMLALELEDRMVGTAYMDDEILSEFADAYNSIPVLAEKYPSKEVLIEAEPDFVYGGFMSAFSDKRGLATREELLELGITSYLSPSFASNKEFRPDPWTISVLYEEIRDIGNIFHIQKRAEAYIESIETKLEQAVPEDADTIHQPLVLWLDSFGSNGPYVGAGSGVPNEIIQLAGGENVFSDVKGSWATVSREDLVGRDYDYIVLIDASWDTAESKIEELKSDPVYAEMEPVEEERFIIIDFSASTPGIRLPNAVKMTADALYR